MPDDIMTVGNAIDGLAGTRVDATLMVELDGEYYPIVDVGGFRQTDDHGDIYVVLAESE